MSASPEPTATATTPPIESKQDVEETVRPPTPGAGDEADANDSDAKPAEDKGGDDNENEIDEHDLVGSDDESILSEVDEAQFEDFDPENVDIEDRPQLDIDEENLKLIGRHKRKRTGDEEGSVFDPSLNGRGEEIWARMLAIREHSKRLQTEMERAGAGAAAQTEDDLDENTMKIAKKVPSFTILTCVFQFP